MKTKTLLRKSIFPFLVIAGISFGWNVDSQTLFSDNFETDTSSQWAIFGGGNGVGITNDYSAQFNFNYSTQTFRFNGAILPIPAAPNSTGGTQHGLKVTANKNRVSGMRIAAVSLYPKNVSFSNNFALRFDMFMDYNGDVPGGGLGSTEYSTFGIDHLGTKVNWFSTRTVTGYIPTDWPSDGVWFMVDGEAGTDGPGNGNPGDYAAYVGDPSPGAAIPLNGANGGFLYNQNVDNTPNPLKSAFPAPPGQTPGAPGKQWVQVEINQIDGVVTWKMNGYVIASHSAGAVQGYTNGTIMLGYNDPLNGIPNPLGENYAIYDNVRVVDLGTSGMLPTVRLSLIDTNAAEPSNPASFSLDRVDSTGAALSGNAIANPLTVNLQITGTASNGVDYVTLPATITFPAGVQSTNLTITPIDDAFGEPTETIIVRILGSTNYDIRTSFIGTFFLDDDGDVPSANFQVIKPVAYENKRDAKINLYLSGTAPGNVSVNYTLTGTATNGVDYVTIPTSQIITTGNTNILISITPLNNALLAPDKTVTFTLTTGSGYSIGTASNATITIRNDDLSPPSSVLFTDNFDTDSSLNWNINKTEPTDLVTFAYDYSADGIPAAPNTTNATTKGVKLEANVTATAAAGISLSPKNGNYTGDYRIRFDAWINYPGNLAGGSSDSTEWLSAGVGTTGVHPIVPAQGDGIWFDTDGDGASSVAADFEAFRGTTSLLVGAADVWVGNSQAAASPYYTEFGEVTAPQSQIDAAGPLGADQSGTTFRGSLGFAWHDMVITKQGTNVTWTVDGLPFAIVPTNGAVLSSNVFIGYYDSSGNINVFPQFAFALFDNFRVESLNVAPPTQPVITATRVLGGNVQIDFTGAASDAASAFTVVSSATVNGTFVTDGTASVSQIGSGSFRATVPLNGNIRFFRIKR
ncbi:MAG: Calx-beta domain-containing protein [Verrucomicrobiota bacterium]